MPISELHVAFNNPYVYNFTAQQVASEDHVQSLKCTVRNIGQRKAIHRRYNRLKLGCGQAYDHSSD